MESSSTSSASNDKSLHRRKFTEEEDHKLKELVEKHGCKKWESIAALIPGRTGRQCRDRYKNYLVPGYFNGQWSQTEDDILREKFLEMGPQWSKMTKFFTGRSANSLKNRWNYFVCRQIPCDIIVPPSSSAINFETIFTQIESPSPLESINDEEFVSVLHQADEQVTSSISLIDMQPMDLLSFDEINMDFNGF